MVFKRLAKDTAVYGLGDLIGKLVTFVSFPIINAWEIDKTAYVSTIIDGDTFEISTGESIRLADIDCPESYEYGYQEATNYLSSLIQGKKVSLDIDDHHRTDNYGRLVCVVYVEQGSRFLNVNKALLDSGFAETWDHNNEFNPNSWNLYERNSEPLPLMELVILVVAIIIILSRSRKK